MASFSFSSGNAAKLLRVPLYAAGRVATLLIPRTRDDWVFGCGAGIGDGALALWEQTATEARRAVWLTGSAHEARDAAARGIPSLPKHSLRGFWRTARARVLVVTHGFGDVNRYAVDGAFIVQLWHGIPLKRIGIDSPETVRVPGPLQRMPGAAIMRRLIGALYRRTTRKIDLIPAASHLVRGRLESAFSLTESHVPVTGEPRVDVLSQQDAVTRRENALGAVHAAVGDTGACVLVLYAPTWRDGAQDPAVPTDAEWDRIGEVLARRDAVLLVRSHPLGAGAYRPPEHLRQRVRTIGSDLVNDITPLLPGIDVLVTDYSSLAFDAALVPVPTVFFAPDLADYVARRGMYGTYADVAGPDAHERSDADRGWARDWDETLAQLDAVLSGGDELEARVARARDLSDRVHAFADGRNAQRVSAAIAVRLASDDRRHRRRRRGRP